LHNHRSSRRIWHCTSKLYSYGQKQNVRWSQYEKRCSIRYQIKAYLRLLWWRVVGHRTFPLSPHCVVCKMPYIFHPVVVAITCYETVCHLRSSHIVWSYMFYHHPTNFFLVAAT
jgi:hypothetical protein